MDHKAIYKYCKHLGCCDACCLRYIGIKNPNAYENIANFVTKYQDETDTKPTTSEPDEETHDIHLPEPVENVVTEPKTPENNENIDSNSLHTTDNSNGVINGIDNVAMVNNNSPPSKKRRLDICISCLGVLQEDNWIECYIMVKEALFKKGYECDNFACALSAPIATLLRERAITLRLGEDFPGYDNKTLTALKEAWKWSFGIKLAKEIGKSLDSGAVSPLLITINFDYADDLQELEILKKVSPQLFEERSKQRRRFVTEFTRRSVELALEAASLQSLVAAGGALPAASARALCVSAGCVHAPAYLAGRYIKLSRNLPQSPWILDGKRVLPSSVQEIIYKPLANFYNFDSEEADRRFKLVAAGREDVDVRCLGEGRPFAIEITDPTKQLSAEQLAKACAHISKSEEVVVKQIVPITKEDLVQLKQGEETKSKTYEALCIKLSHSKYDDVPPDTPIKVTPEDINRINTFRNNPRSTDPITDITQNIPNDVQAIEDNQKGSETSEDMTSIPTDLDTSLDTEDGPVNLDNLEDVRITIQQKTPIRVLHRRPLLTRTKHILQLRAVAVPDNPQLLRLFVRTSAGTYVKEWVHGDLGRSSPALGDIVGAEVDLLALDVTAVHLDWPPVK